MEKIKYQFLDIMIKHIPEISRELKQINNNLKKLRDEQKKNNKK